MADHGAIPGDAPAAADSISVRAELPHGTAPSQDVEMKDADADADSDADADADADGEEDEAVTVATQAQSVPATGDQDEDADADADMDEDAEGEPDDDDEEEDNGYNSSLDMLMMIENTANYLSTFREAEYVVPHPRRAPPTHSPVTSANTVVSIAAIK